MNSRRSYRICNLQKYGSCLQKRCSKTDAFAVDDGSRGIDDKRAFIIMPACESPVTSDTVKQPSAVRDLQCARPGISMKLLKIIKVRSDRIAPTEHLTRLSDRSAMHFLTFQSKTTVLHVATQTATLPQLRFAILLPLQINASTLRAIWISIAMKPSM